MKFSTAAIVAALAATAHGFSLTMSSIGYLENLGKSGSGLTSFAPSSGSSYSYGAPAPAPASYSYGGGAPAPAPASYSYGGGAPAQAPAPAPYKSSFADMPANSSTNYISTIGGGSKMKSGKNYAGVSRSFRPATGFAQSGYLEGIKGKTMQSSGYSSTPSYGSSSSYSYGQPAAPAPAPYSSSYSYGGSAAPAPAPQSSYSYGGSAAPAPAPANGSYLDNLSGGAARGAAQSSSYSGMRSSFSKSAQPMAGATGSYLSQL